MIRYVHLINGESFFADVTENMDGNTILFKKAMVLVQTDRQGGLGLRDYLPYAEYEKGITLEKSRIMFYAPMHAELEQAYIQATSNLVVPPSATTVGSGNSGLKLVT